MKNIILFILMIFIVSCVDDINTKGYEETGTGWSQVLSKQNYKDSVYFNKLPKYLGDNIVISGINSTAIMRADSILQPNGYTTKYQFNPIYDKVNPVNFPASGTLATTDQIDALLDSISILRSIITGIQGEVYPNYYVKTGGDDSADGKTDATAWAHHPWMSTWTGTVVLKAGDRVAMKRGDTWSINNPVAPYITVAQNGSLGNHIITTAYGTGDKPIIKIATESSYNVIYATKKSYITFDNLDIQHWSSANGSYTMNGIRLSDVGGMCHDWLIINNDIHNCPYAGIYILDNAYNIVIGDTAATTTATITEFSNEIFDCGRGGVLTHGADSISLRSNYYVQYNYIHDMRVTGEREDLAYGLAFSASGTTSRLPRYCYARYNYIADIPTWTGMDSHEGKYLYYQDNYLTNCDFFIGIQASSLDTLDHVYIERNIMEQPYNFAFDTCFFIAVNGFSIQTPATNIYIRDNTMFWTTRPANQSVSTYGISLLESHDVIIDGNVMYNGPKGEIDGAIRIRSNNDNVIIRNNHITNWSSSIKLFGTGLNGDIEIYNNIIYSHDRGIYDGYTATTTGNLDIYNNTIIVKDSTNSEPIRLYSQTIGTGLYLKIKNNIIGFSASSDKYYIKGPASVGSGTYELDYNLYWNSSKSTAWWCLGGTKSFATMQGLGYEANGINNTDPTFINAGGSYLLDTDFILNTGSPAINEGTNVSITTDYFGNPRVGNYDIGAVEKQ